MSAQEVATDGSMNNQPRRYRVRAMADVEGLTQTEIADRLGCSQATVQRDLQSTVEPVAKTPGGAPVYPPGRFDADPEFQARVSRLGSEGLPESQARRQAAREFAGAGRSRGMRGQVVEIRSEVERNRLMRQFDQTAA